MSGRRLFRVVLVAAAVVGAFVLWQRGDFNVSGFVWLALAVARLFG